MTQVRLLYVTTPTIDEARALANKLIEQRLIAATKAIE